MFNLKCFFSVEAYTLKITEQFWDYFIGKDDLPEFKSFIIKVDPRLTQEEFESIQPKLEALDRLGLTQYDAKSSYPHYLRVKNLQFMYANSHSFEGCKMIFNTNRVIDLVECFPMHDLLSGQYFTYEKAKIDYKTWVKELANNINDLKIPFDAQHITLDKFSISTKSQQKSLDFFMDLRQKLGKRKVTLHCENQDGLIKTMDLLDRYGMVPDQILELTQLVLSDNLASSRISANNCLIIARQGIIYWFIK